MESLESWKKEVEVKFDTFLSHSKAHAVAMEELRSMFATIVGKEKFLDEGSPSMTEFALESQQQQACKVMQAEDGIGQGPSEADVADPTMQVPETQQPSHAPPASTTELDITLSTTAVTDLPPSQTEENVEVVAAEGLVKTPKTPDSGGPSEDSNSEDGGPAALDEMNSEVSPVQELVSHASPPTAQTKPAEAPPAAGSPSQRRCRRPPKSEQQVISPSHSRRYRLAPSSSFDYRM